MARKGVKMKNKWVSRKELEKDMKKAIFLSKSSVECANCGHKMLLGRKEKRVCSWCHKYIFKDKKEEFEYRLKEKMVK